MGFANREDAGRITVAIIEDNRLVREGLRTLVSSRSNLSVVVAGSSDEVGQVVELGPHVVLLDVGLLNGDSLAVANRLRRERPEAKVIVMDIIPGREDVMEFVRAGVAGFIMNDAGVDALANAIRAVLDGTHVLPPPMVGTLFTQIAEMAATQAQPGVLDSDVRMTPREREVIDLVADGLSNKEIASSLHITVYTVKSHIRSIMEKLALHTRLQIAAYVHEQSNGRNHAMISVRLPQRR